jgi:hypothetical protein
MIRAVIRWILGVKTEPLLDVVAGFAWAVPIVAALSLLSSALESLSITLLVPLLGSLSGQSTMPRFLSPLSFIFEWGASMGALPRILVPAGLMVLLIIVKSGVQCSNAVLAAWVDSRPVSVDLGEEIAELLRILAAKPEAPDVRSDAEFVALPR